ncbi:MAG: hypothetical protein ACRENG_16045, partial [bacterium]
MKPLLNTLQRHKIRWSPLSVGGLFAVSVVVFAANLAAQNVSLPRYPYSLVDRRLVFPIPSDTATIALPDSFIIANSDTLRLGKLTLQRGRDYRLNYRDAILQLTTGDGRQATGDSLILTYRILPLSLPRQFALFHLAKPATQDSTTPVSRIVASAQQDNL